MGFQFESSNPAISSMAQSARDWTDDTNRATIMGVAEKTALLVGVTGLAGAAAYALLPPVFGVLMLSSIVAFVVCLGVGWVLAGTPEYARVLAPIYALAEGVFLGMFTKVLDQVLAQRGLGPEVIGGSLALPAFIITISCAATMLVLYRTGLLRPTETFKAVVMTFTMGVMLTYLVMFVLSLFGVQMPFISLGSAMNGGREAMIGLGLNAAILGLASLWLIIDFGKVEEIVRRGSSKEMEWYGAFAMLVTLAWIYYEAVKLAFRVAMILGKKR